jgi:hypothetical protein
VSSIFPELIERPHTDIVWEMGRNIGLTDAEMNASKPVPLSRKCFPGQAGAASAAALFTAGLRISATSWIENRFSRRLRGLVCVSS